eukprot:5313827-Prymnesium_polylepis.1
MAQAAPFSSTKQPRARGRQRHGRARTIRPSQHTHTPLTPSRPPEIPKARPSVRPHVRASS